MVLTPLLYEIAARCNLDTQDSAIPSPDNEPVKQHYIYSGQQMQLVFMNSSDLRSLEETRQSTSAIMVFAGVVPIY